MVFDVLKLLEYYSSTLFSSPNIVTFFTSSFYHSHNNNHWKHVKHILFKRIGLIYYLLLGSSGPDF